MLLNLLFSLMLISGAEMMEICGEEEGARANEGKDMWSNLDPDLLLVIFGRLGSFVHQLAFRGVCSAWRSVAVPDPKLELWQISPCRRWGKTKLLGSDKFEFVDRSCWRSYPTRLQELQSCIFLMARHGWLLVADEPVTDYDLGLTSFHPFFFNPFSRTMIRLPTFYAPHMARVHRLWFDFSAPPTSPDCVVFMVNYRYEDLLCTMTCQPGMAQWATCLYHHDIDPVWLNDRTMVLSDGVCLCAYQSATQTVVGKVLVFHPPTNSFKSLSHHLPAVDACVLCQKLEPAVAGDILKRLSFPELHSSRIHHWFLGEGLVEEEAPRTVSPFWWAEELGSDEVVLGPPPEQFNCMNYSDCYLRSLVEEEAPRTVSPFRWAEELGSDEVVLGPPPEELKCMNYSDCYLRSALIRPCWPDPASICEWVSADSIAAQDRIVRQMMTPPWSL